MNFLRNLTTEEASAFFGQEIIHERILRHFETGEAANEAGVRFLQSLGLVVITGSTEIGHWEDKKLLRHNYFYALEGSIHAGYLKVDAEPGSKIAQFDSFDLTPTWQGHGLGKRILTAALADLKNRDFTEARSDSVAAAALDVGSRVVDFKLARFFNVETGKRIEGTLDELKALAGTDYAHSTVGVHIDLAGYDPPASQERLTVLQSWPTND